MLALELSEKRSRQNADFGVRSMSGRQKKTGGVGGRLTFRENLLEEGVLGSLEKRALDPHSSHSLPLSPPAPLPPQPGAPQPPALLLCGD